MTIIFEYNNSLDWYEQMKKNFSSSFLIKFLFYLHLNIYEKKIVCYVLKNLIYYVQLEKIFLSHFW